MIKPCPSLRVLGPYRNGDKWRLVMLDGDSRKALVADSYEAALALRDDLKGVIKKHIARSSDESLEEYLNDLVERSATQDTADKVRRMPPVLPLGEPLTAIDAERPAALPGSKRSASKANGEPIANDSHHLLRVASSTSGKTSRAATCSPTPLQASAPSAAPIAQTAAPASTRRVSWSP